MRKLLAFAYALITSFNRIAEPETAEPVSGRLSNEQITDEIRRYDIADLILL